MVQELSNIKEQLFDAPNEVKKSFNKVVNYFDSGFKIKPRVISEQELAERIGNCTTGDLNKAISIFEGFNIKNYAGIFKLTQSGYMILIFWLTDEYRVLIFNNRTEVLTEKIFTGRESVLEVAKFIKGNTN